MIINTPISLGELLDKISILKIKLVNIKEKKKISHIQNELSLLENKLKEIKLDKYILKIYQNKLKIINSKLWNIEDKLRNYEKKKIFNNIFIELARSVYITNDLRSKIKLEINKKFGSRIIEVKSYKKY